MSISSRRASHHGANRSSNRRLGPVTVELKVNLLAPAGGDSLVAEGEVVRAGRTLTVCRGEAYAEQESELVHVATVLATMVRRRS